VVERGSETLTLRSVAGFLLEFSPSLVACCISSANHSFEIIRRSQECVINVPTTDLVNKVIGIGNCSGAEMDKFKVFGLTPAPATNWDDILRLIATNQAEGSDGFRALSPSELLLEATCAVSRP
jgi:flavin reductase (DIM6/NTAB) family NADH-FMN oxidoreductase RutF